MFEMIVELTEELETMELNKGETVLVLSKRPEEQVTG